MRIFEDLLARIRKVQKEYGYDSEYIFANEEGRIHAPVISSCAKNKCKQVGIPYKSIRIKVFMHIEKHFLQN